MEVRRRLNVTENIMRSVNHEEEVNWDCSDTLQNRQQQEKSDDRIDGGKEEREERAGSGQKTSKTGARPTYTVQHRSPKTEEHGQV